MGKTLGIDAKTVRLHPPFGVGTVARRISDVFFASSMQRPPVSKNILYLQGNFVSLTLQGGTDPPKPTPQSTLDFGCGAVGLFYILFVLYACIRMYT